MDDLSKFREILFQAPHPDRNQAHTAAHLLLEIEGVFHTEPAEPLRLHVGYDLSLVTLQEIDLHLLERGFHLDNSLIVKLKRALFYYTEDTLRANLGTGAGRRGHTQNVFVNQYDRREHGCRDQRPTHWRNYL